MATLSHRLSVHLLCVRVRVRVCVCVANQSHFQFNIPVFEADFMLFNLFRFVALQWTYVPLRICTMKITSLCFRCLFWFHSFALCFTLFFRILSFIFFLASVFRPSKLWNEKFFVENFKQAHTNPQHKTFEAGLICGCVMFAKGWIEEQLFERRKKHSLKFGLLLFES